MQEKNRITQAVFDAIEEMNDQLPDGRELAKSSDTALFGTNGNLDSIELVSFIVLVEEKLEDGFDTSLSLGTEKAISMISSPFKTVGTLVDYIESLFEDLDRG